MFNHVLSRSPPSFRYKAWHAFAVMNFETLIYFKQQAELSLVQQQQQGQQGKIIMVNLLT